MRFCRTWRHTGHGSEPFASSRSCRVSDRLSSVGVGLGPSRPGRVSEVPPARARRRICAPLAGSAQTTWTVISAPGAAALSRLYGHWQHRDCIMRAIKRESACETAHRRTWRCVRNGARGRSTRLVRALEPTECHPVHRTQLSATSANVGEPARVGCARMHACECAHLAVQIDGQSDMHLRSAADGIWEYHVRRCSGSAVMDLREGLHGERTRAHGSEDPRNWLPSPLERHGPIRSKL